MEIRDTDSRIYFTVGTLERLTVVSDDDGDTQQMGFAKDTNIIVDIEGMLCLFYRSDEKGFPTGKSIFDDGSTLIIDDYVRYKNYRKYDTSYPPKADEFSIKLGELFEHGTVLELLYTALHRHLPVSYVENIVEEDYSKLNKEVQFFHNFDFSNDVVFSYTADYSWGALFCRDSLTADPKGDPGTRIYGKAEGFIA